MIRVNETLGSAKKGEVLINTIHPNLIACSARVSPSGAQLLGTCFAVAETKFATAAHTLQQADKSLVLAIRKTPTIGDYQDTTDREVQTIPAKISAFDPIRDIAVLEIDGKITLPYRIGSSDSAPPGAPVVALGFPHADHGRLVLTRQNTSVGARIILSSSDVKTKHIVLNIQSRPGQSGSPIFLGEQPEVCAMIIGSYAPSLGGGISLGGIDPQTLHQTTHAISTEYIRGMI